MASPGKTPKNDFRVLLDLFFKYQRAHYHLWNIQSSPGEYKIPPGMEKTVDKLSKLNKVAEPTPTTQARLEQNARFWAKGSLEAMEVHYLRTIEELTPRILQANQDDWEAAWETATNWMRKRFKTRFTTTILAWALREVSTLKKGTVPGATPPIPDSLPAPTPPDNIPDEIPPTPPQPSTLNQPQIKIKLPLPKSPNTSSPRDHIPTETTPTKLRKVTKRLLPSPDKPVRTPLTKPKGTAKSPTPSPSKSPKRTKTTSTTTTPLKRRKETSSSPSSSSSSLLHPPRPSLLPKGHLYKGLNPPGTKITSRKTFSLHPQIRTSQEAGPSETLPLETAAFTRHEHRGNKALNWSLKPRRPYLIIGDSNLSRLPLIHHSEVQVDCFPGAKIHHITRILKHKTPASPVVRTVVLSVGINNRNQESSTPGDGMVRALMEAAGYTFPHARIRIAALNWSKQLPLPTISNLIRINAAILRTQQAINPLPQDQFVTEDDGIHWTTATAEGMWRHWKRFFNL